ncbi:hypothetical protein [Flavobacterium sp. Root186]|uniref:hypothetical protein n=1 Tax=Flavobacterium sp. Root186 TaxID=1736485 RepID=UPI0006FC9524|nr:hypothetical protein [Flavobacterium sp. Root186]KRB59920.1 hypothetical protein ASD98_02060 [Flavobacterium sp. Root186]
MENQQLFVANYKTQQQAEDAIKKLKKSGYDITKLSLIGKDCYIEQNILGYFNIYDKMEKWSTTGLFAIGLCGLIFGMLFIFNVMASFPYFRIPIIYACIAILLGATLPLIGMGFSKDKTIKYSTEVKARKYVLFAQETNANIEIMRTILDTHVPKQNSIQEKENQTLLENEAFDL